MGSAAWAKPFTIRRPPQGGAKRERLEAHLCRNVQKLLPYEESPSPQASLMPPTPLVVHPKIIKMSGLKKKCRFLSKWSPTGPQWDPKNHKNL